jgi:hypothetical protein
MLVTEWNLDTALKVSKAEGIAEGEAKGIVKGVDQVLELIRQGITSEAEIRRHLDSSNQTESTGGEEGYAQQGGGHA